MSIYVSPEGKKKLAELAELVKQRATIDSKIEGTVRELRKSRSTSPYWHEPLANWDAIAGALGVKKQAAHRKYAHVDPKSKATSSRTVNNG